MHIMKNESFLKFIMNTTRYNTNERGNNSSRSFSNSKNGKPDSRKYYNKKNNNGNRQFHNHYNNAPYVPNAQPSQDNQTQPNNQHNFNTYNKYDADAEWNREDEWSCQGHPITSSIVHENQFKEHPTSTPKPKYGPKPIFKKHDRPNGRPVFSAVEEVKEEEEQHVQFDEVQIPYWTEKEANEVIRELNETKRRLKATERRLIETEQKLDSLNGLNVNMEKIMITKESEIKKLRDENAKIVKEFDDYKRDSESVPKKELDKSIKKVNDLNAELSKARKEINRLHEELGNRSDMKKADVNKMVDEFFHIKKESEINKQSNEFLKKQVSELKEQIKELRSGKCEKSTQQAPPPPPVQNNQLNHDDYIIIRAAIDFMQAARGVSKKAQENWSEITERYEYKHTVPEENLTKSILDKMNL